MFAIDYPCDEPSFSEEPGGSQHAELAGAKCVDPCVSAGRLGRRKGTSFERIAQARRRRSSRQVRESVVVGSTRARIEAVLEVQRSRLTAGTDLGILDINLGYSDTANLEPNAFIALAAIQNLSRRPQLLQ